MYEITLSKKYDFEDSKEWSMVLGRSPCGVILEINKDKFELNKINDVQRLGCGRIKEIVQPRYTTLTDSFLFPNQANIATETSVGSLLPIARTAIHLK